MSVTRVPAPLRDAVRSRSGGRCEYCLVHEDDPFEPQINYALTNARLASLHGLPVGPSPSGSRPFRCANRALVTSDNLAWAARAVAFRLRSAAVVALRLRCAIRFSPPSAPLSPLTDRRPKRFNPSWPGVEPHVNPRSTLAFRSEVRRQAIPNVHGRE